jgi:hypothetical protein
MAGAGNETLLINGHVIGTRLDQSVPKNLSSDRALSSCRSGSGVFAGVLNSPAAPDDHRPLLHEEVLYSVRFGNKQVLFAADSSATKSPLTDSNRRPPPYHRAKRGETRASEGIHGHEPAANARKRSTTTDREWTRVPAGVFPQCSLAQRSRTPKLMTDDLRQSAAEWAERTAIEQGLPPRVTDIATLRHVARLLGLLEPDGRIE